MELAHVNRAEDALNTCADFAQPRNPVRHQAETRAPQVNTGPGVYSSFFQDCPLHDRGLNWELVLNVCVFYRWMRARLESLSGLAVTPLVVLILLHRGKGGGLSDLFGGGVSSSIGGSSVAEKNLDRLTVGLGLVWAACIIAVGLLVSTAA